MPGSQSFLNWWREGNPFAEGGNNFGSSPWGRVAGNPTAPVKPYGPSPQGGGGMGMGGGMGNPFADMMGMLFGSGQQPSMQPAIGQYGRQAMANQRATMNPVTWQGVIPGAGQGAQAGASNPWQYNTGINAQPVTGGPTNAMASLRATPGGSAPSLNQSVSRPQQAALNQQMADVSGAQGNRAALGYQDTVNQGESALKMAQNSAQSQSGLAHQRFGNQRLAHQLGMQDQMNGAQWGLLSQILGGMFG